MTRIIPPKLIEHLEWNPGQEVPVSPAILQAGQPDNTRSFTVEEIINNYQVFYSEEKDSDDKYIGVPIALRQALEFASDDGIILTMPELIASKIAVDKEHKFWKNWYTAQTEENIGIDESGTFVSSGEPVLVVVHGGGILTPERIEQAYEEGLINNSAKYTNEEFNNLLKGELPGGNSIPLYQLDDLKNGISETNRRYGVVMPFSDAQSTNSGYHKRDGFLVNPLALARTGDLTNLEKYFDLAKDSDGDVGNWHPFSGRDPTQPQGRVLFLSSNYDGLDGSSGLNNDGRFVGVSAGGASRARGR